MKEKLTLEDKKSIEGCMVAWLIQEIERISEEAYAAGWATGIEHSLFDLIEKGIPDEEVDFGMTELWPFQIVRLSKVAEITGKWVIWSDEEKRPVSIPVDEYRAKIRVGQ